MKKEVFDLVKRELQYIGLLFLSALIIFKIIFLKEGLVAVFRTVLSLFWLFVLPGYSIMLYWEDKIEFMERFIIGISLAAGIIGVLSYYIGLIGLNIKYHAVLLPLAIIIAGFIATISKE